MADYEDDRSEFLYHTKCDACHSSDGKAVYSNGGTYCFVCNTAGRGEKMENTPRNKGTPQGLLAYEYTDLNKRKIPEAIVKQYSYGMGHDSKGILCQIANYFNDKKELVAQKLRYADKSFKFIGNPKEALMFGQQLWGNTGRKLIITEGEIDALSVATAFDGKYPVVSIKNGSSAAKKELATHLDWISGYQEVFLWFDSDDAGRQAVEECLTILPVDKVRIIRSAEYKDANDILIYKGKAGILNAFYNAEKYKPDDIVTPSDLLDVVAVPVQVGFDYYYSQLTDALYGRRFGEVVTVGAGVSIGKTDFVVSQIAFDLQQGWKVGTFILEQSTKETLQRVAGKIDGCHYHLPKVDNDKEKLLETTKSLEGSLFMFDNFGSNDWESISAKMRYMFHNFNIRIFYIDNLTALNAHATDERRNLDGLMAEVAGLAKELDIWILLVSHLNPPKSGASHESGGKTEQGQFTGSRAIMRWSYAMFGIERNTLHEDPAERNKGLVRILKDRFSGTGTGLTVGFTYDSDTGICHQTDEGFELEVEKTTDDDF